MEDSEDKGVAHEGGHAVNVDRDRRRRRRRRRAMNSDAGGPFGVFWISGIAVVGTFVVVILVYWLLLAG